MIKIDFKWDEKIEKKLYREFKRLLLSLLNGEKIKNKDKISKIFLDYSLKMERKYKKKVNAEKHLEITKNQILQINEWVEKSKKYINENKEKTDFKKKLINNAKFRSRNMLGNYYKDFLKKIISEESECFEWNTMGDERVRETHREKDGQIFTWDNAEIIPGEEVNCRCWATVYFAENKEELEGIKNN